MHLMEKNSIGVSLLTPICPGFAYFRQGGSPPQSGYGYIDQRHFLIFEV